MSRKKWVSLIAMLCILLALTMYSVLKEENNLREYFWIPLVIGAVFLFAATRIK